MQRPKSLITLAKNGRSCGIDHLYDCLIYLLTRILMMVSCYIRALLYSSFLVICLILLLCLFLLFISLRQPKEMAA